MVKHIQKIIGGTLLILVCMTTVQAQGTRAFFLKGKKSDLRLTAREDGNNTAAVMAGRGRSNELAQLFYFKRVPSQPGNVWIVSAKNPDLFLKRNGNNVVFTTYDNAQANDYTWSIDYAGYPFCLIALPDNGQRALQVHGHESLRVSNNISGLDNDTADDYRFRLTWKNDVF